MPIKHNKVAITADDPAYDVGSGEWNEDHTGTLAHSALTGLTAGDDHTQYQKESEKAVANGYAGLGATALVPTAQLGTGTASSTTYLSGAGTWTAPAGGGGTGAPTPHGAADHTGDVIPAANQDFGAYYSDIAQIVAPASPGAGVRRVFMDSGTGKLSVRTSAGTTVSLEEQGGGGGGGSTVKDHNPMGNVLSPSAAIDVIVWRAPVAGTITAVRGYRVGGTGATVNARRNGTLALLSADLSLTAADSWTAGSGLQNASVAAGDKVEIRIVTVTGGPTQVAVQVDFTESTATATQLFAPGATVIAPSAAVTLIVWRAPVACTVTGVRGYRVGGTGAVVNAKRAGLSLLSTDLSLTSADTWSTGTGLQNTTVSAGDKIEVVIVSTAGSPSQVAIQVDVTT